jgi:hypothetical protein
MYKFMKMFMPDGDGVGGMGGEAAGPSAPPDGGTPPQPIEGVNDPNGEGTSPDEIAKILGGKAGTAAAAATPKEAPAEPVKPETAPAEPVAPAEPAAPAGTTPAAPAAAPATPATEAAATPAAPVEPPDFSITVEDKNGVSFKIAPGDDIDEVLADFEPKGTGQVMAIMRELAAKEQEKGAWDKEQAETTERAAHDERVQQIQASWQTEIKDLQAAKKLPTTADGSPSPRETEVFAFMGEENRKRDEKGIARLASFGDALTQLEAKEATAAAETAAKEAKLTARTNGAKIGGSSTPGSSAPKAYKANSGYRNATQALKAQNLL